MEKEVTLLAILQELRDFRKENNTRLEVLENRLDKLECRESKLDERMSRIESKMETLEDKMLDLEKRADIIENKKEKERKELFDVLDNMQKKLMNIIEQKSQEIKEYMDLKFKPIESELEVNKVEHKNFNIFCKEHENRLDFYGSRLENLEDWKEDFDCGMFTLAY